MHCGGSFDLQFPIPLTQVTKIFGAFGKVHEFCVKEELQNEEQVNEVKVRIQYCEKFLREIKSLDFDETKIVNSICGVVQCQIEKFNYLITDYKTKTKE